ncbi:hypothetical protein [Kluyvera georgiana]|uniref:hypothetical protein n=1 Tax=Kluyvera georgiana TaxID=73098 RepID=UPI000807174D|nr:hypothetical protein [Kluyvera georgiana]
MAKPSNKAPDTDYVALKGSKIGSGGSRIVYKLKGYKRWVLKECIVPGNKPNKYEAMIYDTAVKRGFSDLLKTLAKIHGVSYSGKYLIMEKLTVGTIKNGMSCKVMEELTDLKKDNFGKDKKGRIKSLDYVTLKKSVKPECISGNVVNHIFPSDENICQMESLMDLVKE